MNGWWTKRHELLDSLNSGEFGKALPFWAYRDEDFYRFEVRHCFYRDWVAVAPAGAVREAGDCVEVRFAHESVIVLRDDEGNLRCLANACRHRGAPLLQGEGKLKRLSCPYHRWSYHLDGRFAAAPFDDKRAPRGCRNLQSYAIEEWHGVLFVNLGPNPKPLKEKLAGVSALMGLSYAAPLPSTEVKLNRGQLWKANWKLVFENAAESYHLFAVHPKTLDTFSPTRDSFAVKATGEWCVTGGKLRGGGEYRLLALPPSFVGIAQAGTMMWLAALPSGAESSRVLGGYSAPSRWYHKAAGQVADPWMDEVMREDQVLVEAVQGAMASRLARGSELLPIEAPVADFQRYLHSRLPLNKGPLPMAQAVGS